MNKPIPIEDRPVIITKGTFDILLKQEHPGKCMALYNFYYYTAVWQKTNQPKCTVEYAAKGLKWSTKTIQKYKKTLKDLGLIADVQRRNTRNSIIGHYMQVFYYQKQENTKPTPPKTHRVADGGTNAYRAGNNCRGEKKHPDGVLLTSLPKEDFYSISTKKLYTAIVENRKIMRKVNIKQWSNQFAGLCIKDGIKYARVEKVLEWYIKHIKDKYTPKAYAATTFRSKFLQIEDAMERVGGNIKVTKDAKVIIEKLQKMNLYIPNTNSSVVIEQFETTVQRILSYYTFILDRHNGLLTEMRKNPEKYKSIKSFVKYLNENYQEPVPFVTALMISLQHKISQVSKNWHGSLYDLAMEEFLRTGRAWSDIYCGSEDRWDSYMLLV